MVKEDGVHVNVIGWSSCECDRMEFEKKRSSSSMGLMARVDI